MSDWFIRLDGEHDEIGPLRPSDLLKKVRSGEVTRETLLRKDGSSWFPARDVGGLFEAAMRPTIEYFCPQCRKEISEPPLRCPHCDQEVRKAVTRITENTIVNRQSRGSKDAGSKDETRRSVDSWLRKKQLGKRPPNQDGKGS